jgi:hypothetical protein
MRKSVGNRKIIMSDLERVKENARLASCKAGVVEIRMMYESKFVVHETMLATDGSKENAASYFKV